MVVMRIRWCKLGGHIHCRVFTAPGEGFTFAKNGDLCFSEQEWGDVALILDGAELIEENAIGEAL